MGNLQIQFELGKMLFCRYFGATFYSKPNGDTDSPVARKRCVFTQLKWYDGGKGFLSAVTVKNRRGLFFQFIH